MAGLLNIGEMSALALHALVELAETERTDPGKRLGVPELAGRLSASQHTLHKVITRLVNEGMVDSARGPSGGIRLSEPPEDINILRVVEAVDGKVNSNACLFANRVCPPGAPCAFSSLTDKLESQIREHFVNTTIKKLMDSLRKTRRLCK